MNQNKENKMKRLLVSVLFFTFLSAEISLLGGVNFGNIQYNSDNEMNLESRTGANVGMEIDITQKLTTDWWHPKAIKVGGAFIQRGTNRDSGFDVYNYVTAHSLYYLNWGSIGSLNLDKNFPIYIGLQLGACIGGTVDEGIAGDENNSLNLDGDDFNFNYGLLLGGDIMISNRMGIRVSYYKGFANAMKDRDEDENFKHTGIGIGILYNLYD